MFADRARENIHLAVNDDVKISGRFSHDNMFRELHFFPRRQLPSLEIDHANGLLKVTLPTGEPVLFDQHSMELVGGALKEAPIDFNSSRYARHNPEVRYQGDYIAITVAQRGEAPRRASVWGQTKQAEVYYPAKYKKSVQDVAQVHLGSEAQTGRQRPDPEHAAQDRYGIVHRHRKAVRMGPCGIEEISPAAGQGVDQRGLGSRRGLGALFANPGRTKPSRHW
ncbi:MAG: hypothetical protein H6962_07020 [Chromatiaceae bacterium]|nr:hypothetical protein [Chromatiaceae bacterium]